MKCVDCPHFRIRSYPLKAGGECWDLGLAVCDKHSLVVDWMSKLGLKRLRCVDDCEPGTPDNIEGYCSFGKR